MIKRKMLLVAMSVFVVMILLGPSPAPAKKPIVLKAVSFVPLHFVDNTPLRELISRIKQKSNGELVIDFAGAFDVIPVYDQAEAVRKGVVDMSMSFVAVYSKLVPEVQSLTYSEIEPWEERQRGYFDYMVDLHKKTNLRYLGRSIIQEPCFYFLSNKRIVKIGDFAGMKFCTGPVFVPVLKALGASGVVMPQPDKYGAMERGLVDGINNPLILSEQLHLYEVSKYFLDYGLFKADTTFIMNLDKWNNLPKHLQELLINETGAIERDMKAYFDSKATDAKKKFKDAGVQFIYLSSDDTKKLQDIATESCWAEIAKSISPENYSKLRKLLSK